MRSRIGEGGVGAAVMSVNFVGYSVSMVVCMNVLRNQTVDSASGGVSEARSVSPEMVFLYGGNVLTMLGGEGDGIVWLEKFTVA